MFKTKLLILLLINFLFISCTKESAVQNTLKFKVGYIGGEYDGLLLKNTLNSYLNAQNIYDESSQYEIKANISHDSNLYITNTDNTSDRERITSTLSVLISDNRSSCQIYNFNQTISQFYIFAASDLFLSNKKAVKEIKKSNTDELVKEFFKNLNRASLICNDQI